MKRWHVEGYGPTKFYVFEVEAENYWAARDVAAEKLQNEPEGLPEHRHVTVPEIEFVIAVPDQTEGS
jgi:hypothetical protein